MYFNKRHQHQVTLLKNFSNQITDYFLQKKKNGLVTYTVIYQLVAMTRENFIKIQYEESLVYIVEFLLSWKLLNNRSKEMWIHFSVLPQIIAPNFSWLNQYALVNDSWIFSPDFLYFIKNVITRHSSFHDKKIWRYTQNSLYKNLIYSPSIDSIFNKIITSHSWSSLVGTGIFKLVSVLTAFEKLKWDTNFQDNPRTSLFSQLKCLFRPFK